MLKLTGTMNTIVNIVHIKQRVRTNLENTTKRSTSQTAWIIKAMKMPQQRNAQILKRLQVIYHQSLDELNTVKSEYEAKLILANDNYRVVKTENEVLKEKVDVLFKLGRSYLNNAENKKKNDGQREVDETEKIETVMVEDIAETEGVENLEEWS